MTKWANNKKFYTDNIHLSKEAKAKLQIKCKEIFLKHHPEYAPVPLSDGFMIEHIIDYYIES